MPAIYESLHTDVPKFEKLYGNPTHLSAKSTGIHTFQTEKNILTHNLT